MKRAGGRKGGNNDMAMSWRSVKDHYVPTTHNG